MGIRDRDIHVRHIAQLHSVTPDEREGGQQRDREKKGVYKVPSFERFERNIRFLRAMIGGM